MSLPLDRDTMFDQRDSLARDLPVISATITLAMLTIQRTMRVEKIELIVDATYAADPTNYYVLTAQHGATALGSWSTLTGAQGTITAGTPVSMVLTADTGQNLVMAAGEVLSLLATKNAAAANIQPRIVVHGRYV